MVLIRHHEVPLSATRAPLQCEHLHTAGAATPTERTPRPAHPPIRPFATQPAEQPLRAITLSARALRSSSGRSVESRANAAAQSASVCSAARSSARSRRSPRGTCAPPVMLHGACKTFRRGSVGKRAEERGTQGQGLGRRGVTGCSALSVRSWMYIDDPPTTIAAWPRECTSPMARVASAAKSPGACSCLLHGAHAHSQTSGPRLRSSPTRPALCR
jgi:hypothetical protein